MHAVDAINEVWLTYQVTKDALKITTHGINRGAIELLQDTFFINSSTDKAKNDLAICRRAAGDYAILSMWAIFERYVSDALVRENGKMLDVPPSEFNSALHRKIEEAIEYWRANDVLDLIKPLVGADLVGKAKQIKRYRDWLAHKNPKKASPGNVPPTVAYQVFSDILQLLSFHRSELTENS
jgi:hypothetical protein